MMGNHQDRSLGPDLGPILISDPASGLEVPDMGLFIIVLAPCHFLVL